jgi:hypothetical protein
LFRTFGGFFHVPTTQIYCLTGAIISETHIMNIYLNTTTRYSTISYFLDNLLKFSSCYFEIHCDGTGQILSPEINWLEGIITPFSRQHEKCQKLREQLYIVQDLNCSKFCIKKVCYYINLKSNPIQSNLNCSRFCIKKLCYYINSSA